MLDNDSNPDSKEVPKRDAPQDKRTNPEEVLDMEVGDPSYKQISFWKQKKWEVQEKFYSFFRSLDYFGGWLVSLNRKLLLPTSVDIVVCSPVRFSKYSTHVTFAFHGYGILRIVGRWYKISPKYQSIAIPTDVPIEAWVFGLYTIHKKPILISSTVKTKQELSVHLHIKHPDLTRQVPRVLVPNIELKHRFPLISTHIISARLNQFKKKQSLIGSIL